MAIIQKPDALSMLGNMKKFIVSSGSQISFELKEGSTVLLAATYEPGTDGKATIDVKDIIESRLKYNILHTARHEQTEIVKTFTAVIDGVSSSFKVIRAGVANLADTPSNWLRGNFLTWQPQNKKVTYHSPEWLTYYAQEACSIMLKAYFPDDTVQNINLGACEAGKAFTFNLQYALIVGTLGQNYPTHYEVWAENLSGTRLTYIQRYLYSDPLSELEQWFLFENSLGGLDTLRAYGDSDFTGNHEHKLSSVDDVLSEYDIDTERLYNKNTGFLDEYERKWLLDYFPSKRKYIYHSASIRPIVVKDSDVKYSASDLPSSYNFTYKFSDAQSAVLLNLIRSENIPDIIAIPNLETPDFLLPPRLAEFPSAELHEGVILPAFDPHSDEAKVTTIGAILQAAVFEVFQKIEAGEGGGELVNVLRSTSSEVESDYSVFSSLRTIREIQKYVSEKTYEFIKSTDTQTELTDENALSSLRTLLEIAKANEDLLEDISRKFLRKDIEDTAREKITFLKGIISKSHSYIEAPLDVDKKLTAKEGLQIGASFAGGLTGHGGTIDEGGNAELQSLILRTFLEVPELRFNRIDVIAGDLWNTRGAGIIEEVDTVNQIITLKLEKGEIGRFRYDDIVMGIFHSFNDADNSVDDYDDGLGNRRYSGFGTSYFRVTQILDADRYSKFRYELRPISPRYSKQFHPQPFMTSAAYGNFTNEERQTSMYQTTSYIRLLRNVNNWEFGIENIGMQWGDLSNLSIFGLDMTGYSAYMENVYFSGIIHQLSAKIKEQLDAQRVGGKNLLREYDIRFGFKYWGNAGEYTEFDINQIESTPQLQVQPNMLNWTFPIRYGTVVVTANEAWNITTPNWLNAYPSAGSGNKNVDLKAGEYKGRDARLGTVAVQSGVIQRNVFISQAGLTEFVTINPILNVGYEAQTVTITGKSNSRKLTFTVDGGYLEINLPAQYNVNGDNVSNGSLIAGDPGALDEYSFSITVAVGENVEEFSIQNNIFATANGGQKAISTIVQRRTRVKVLADTDNSIISIGNMIFHIN